jgi:hypothetical protein
MTWTTGIMHPLAAFNETNYDIALISTAIDWDGLGLDADDVARIALYSTRLGEEGTALMQDDLFSAVGYGRTETVGAGIELRFDPDPVLVDQVFTTGRGAGTMLRNYADRVLMCKGDSGSPAFISSSTGLPITCGAHSRSDGFPCTQPGSDQWWAMTGASGGWLQETIQTRFARSCSTVDLAINAEVTMRALECW